MVAATMTKGIKYLGIRISAVVYQLATVQLTPYSLGDRLEFSTFRFTKRVSVPGSRPRGLRAEWLLGRLLPITTSSSGGSAVGCELEEGRLVGGMFLELKLRNC